MIAARPWVWRNLRHLQVYFSFEVFPWQWRISAWKESDYSELSATVQFVFISIGMHANCGNCSTGDWRARFGLSDDKAWERAGR